MARLPGLIDIQNHCVFWCKMGVTSLLRGSLQGSNPYSPGSKIVLPLMSFFEVGRENIKSKVWKRGNHISKRIPSPDRMWGARQSEMTADFAVLQQPKICIHTFRTLRNGRSLPRIQSRSKSPGKRRQGLFAFQSKFAILKFTYTALSNSTELSFIIYHSKSFKITHVNSTRTSTPQFTSRWKIIIFYIDAR